MENNQPSPSQGSRELRQLSVQLARWSAGIHLQDDRMAADLARWQDLCRGVHGHDLDLRTLHLSTLRLRRLIVPGLSIRQVLELDDLLDCPQWTSGDGSCALVHEVFRELCSIPSNRPVPGRLAPAA